MIISEQKPLQEIIDSLNYELLACDTENVVLGTVLNHIKETDSIVFNNAVNKLMNENWY